MKVDFRRQRDRQNLRFFEAKVRDFVEHFRSGQREETYRTSTANPSTNFPNEKSSVPQNSPNLKISRNIKLLYCKGHLILMLSAT